MTSIDWTAFDSLPGSKSQNFENLCRALIRLHCGRYGQFAALKNNPGVEFHLKLLENCPTLGDPPRWYGWQCKSHERTSAGDLRAASRMDIEDSLKKTEKHLPDITDWVLWTPYTLSKKDQEWFKSLQTKLRSHHQWAEEEIDMFLSGQGLILRSTYFGDLIATPEELKQRHREAIQPIRERWLDPVHQSVDAERTIRRMLGEPGSWGQMIAVGQRLAKAVDVMSDSTSGALPQLEKTIAPFVVACSAFADTLLHFHEILADGDIDIIQQKLGEQKMLIDAQVHVTLRRLRTWNLPIALDATNALYDMHIAQELLDEAQEFLGVGLVALLADAGGGKTQMAAQLTAPQEVRPAGILLHGRDLHRGQTVNEALGRKFFCRVQSLLVANKNATSLSDYLSHQYLGGGLLPENPSVTYTFAGEIPWSSTFPENGLSEFSFATKEETEEGEKNCFTFDALIPVCDFGWEGYQTTASDAGQATTLAKEIASDLELIGQPQTFDLFAKDGVKATFNISDQSNDSDNHQSMFFIREDLLKAYLKKNDFALIWAIWGEREHSSDHIHKLSHGPDRDGQNHSTFSFVKRYEQ
jgi:hypothetical protein